jgi:hypothetical protein
MVDITDVRHAAVTKRLLASVGACRADPERANRDEKNQRNWTTSILDHIRLLPQKMCLPF